ncbi:MAG TPA: PKD domain-containing protein [bacterium]
MAFSSWVAVSSTTVTDGSGTDTAVRTDQIRVTVNYPPVADAGGKRVVAVGENVVFDASFSHDPDGEVVEYLWKLGQGVEHKYENPGTVQIQLTVRDDAGAEDVHSTELVVNAKPAASMVPIGRTAPGQMVFFDGKPITRCGWGRRRSPLGFLRQPNGRRRTGDAHL